MSVASTPVAADGEPAPPGEAAAEVPDERVARLVHPRVIRWAHWLNVPVFFVMLWSGLRIYWADDVFAAGLGPWEIFGFFPDGFYEQLDLDRHLARGMAFHFSFAWLFVVNGLIYLTSLVRTGRWRNLTPDRRSPIDALAVALHDLHLRREEPPKGQYNAAQKLAYSATVLMATLLVVSGFAMFKPETLRWLVWLLGGYQRARLIHFTMTMGLSLFVVVHVLQVVRAGWDNARGMVTGYVTEPPPPLPVSVSAPVSVPDPEVSA